MSKTKHVDGYEIETVRRKDLEGSTVSLKTHRPDGLTVMAVQSEEGRDAIVLYFGSSEVGIELPVLIAKHLADSIYTAIMTTESINEKGKK